MSAKSTKTSKKIWENFDYNKAARILKHSGFLKADLRKALTPYYKRKVRELYKENDGSLYNMAKFKEESKNRNRMEKLAGINKGERLTSDFVTRTIVEKLVENPDNLSKRQLAELNKLYIENRKSILHNPNNYGLRNFTSKKYGKPELKILDSHGWNIKNGHAILPIHTNSTEKYLGGLWFYEFPNKSRVVCLVQENKTLIAGRKYTYHMLANSSELLDLIENLVDSENTNLYPDLIYTSPTKARVNDHATKVADLGEFLFYVGNQATNKKSQSMDDHLYNKMIESMRIDSDIKPRLRFKPIDQGF